MDQVSEFRLHISYVAEEPPTKVRTRRIPNHGFRNYTTSLYFYFTFVSSGRIDINYYTKSTEWTGEFRFMNMKTVKK